MIAARHIPALDGVRGLAAALVVASHFPSFSLPRLLEPHVGDYGVLLFFILSGFLMGYLYLPRTPDREALIVYAAARVARIVPLYACVSLLSFFIFSFIYKDFVYPIGLPELIRQGTFTSSVSVFWSIGPEFQFYFLFPFIWALPYAGLKYRTWLYIVMGGVLVLCYLATPWLPGFSAFAKMHIFIAGILCSLVVHKSSQAQLDRLFLPLSLFTLLCLALMFFPVPPALEAMIFPSTRHDPKHIVYYNDLLKIAACTLMILGATIDHPFNRFFWANPAMRRLGAYSFSLYLIHMPIFQIVTNIGSAMGISVAMQSALAVTLSLLGAALSHELFEKPFGQWVRRKMTLTLTKSRPPSTASTI